MLVHEAKSIAREWVDKEARRRPGLLGAYFAGSINTLPDKAPLPATSDLDLNVFLQNGSNDFKRGKFVYRDLLIDLTCVSQDELRSPEQVLGHYHLAGGLRRPGILLDSSGFLAALQQEVARDFAREKWVRRRCSHARGRILEHLATLSPSNPLHDQVTSWIFATGVTTHVLLVAGLQNPTVRRRYVAVRELLANRNQLDLHEELLQLLECAQITRTRAAGHLAALAEVFDAAATSLKTPVPFASDISAHARPIAIDGSRELINRGLHREALFWMVVTYCRCQKILSADAPAACDRFDPGFQALLSDLGVVSFAHLQRRGERLKAFLPRLSEAAEKLIATHPEIIREA